MLCIWFNKRSQTHYLFQIYVYEAKQRHLAFIPNPVTSILQTDASPGKLPTLAWPENSF